MSDITAYIAQTFLTALVIVFFCGVGVTLAVMYGLPWLWRLIKPWLHAITVAT